MGLSERATAEEARIPEVRVCARVRVRVRVAT